MTENHCRHPRLLVGAGLVWLGPKRVLVHRRPPDAGFGAGAMELPGGKVERGEHPSMALSRELVEEWGPAAAGLSVGPLADVLHHCYPSPGPEVVLIVYHVDGAPLLVRGGDERDWGLHPEAGIVLHACALGDLPVDAFLDADRPWISQLAAGRVARPSEFDSSG